MKAQLLGISGSPIPNSNADRLIEVALTISGLNTEIVKLPSIKVKSCITCLGCTNNIISMVMR
ncbi:hypothetical protein [Desulfosediminicola sp.]|uniref:hypothetical protein n=1 Tax=Desulfosediminicola sp. TaxID=2886825 RepID=UPI003AF28074